jgi:hypothetical protein
MKTLVLTAALIAAGSTVALAHGAANWIMNDPRTAHCCGPTDCHMEMANDVRPDGQGWLVVSTGQRFTSDDPSVYPSIDGHYWTCRKYPNPMPQGNMWIRVGKKQVACLFVPMQS